LTIYQRTPDGQWAAYSPESPLPRRLKIFLKAIDGKMTEEVYAKNLVAFGDVREVLKSLQESGLIEDILVARARAAGQTDGLSSAAISPIAPVAPATPVNTLNPGPSPVSNPVPAVFQQGPRTYQTAPTKPQAGSDISAQPAQPERNLKLAIEAMSGFVLVHLPGAAFHVLLEIEALQSIDQLVAMMDGYAQFVMSAGEPGTAHLVELNHLISLAGGHKVNLKKEASL
jgi:hypothetical protein